MKINRIWAVILRHFYEARHNFDRIMDMVYWPILDVLIWGFLTVYLAHNTTSNINIATIILGAVILWNTFYSFQRDLSMGFLDELWSRNLLNLFSTPITVWEYITGLISINFFKMIVGFIASILLAWVIYAFNIVPYAIKLLPYFFNLILFALSIGIFVTGLIFRYSTRVQGFAWGFAGLLGPISCVFYPLSVLPQFLQPIALMLPSTHTFEGMRQIILEGIFSYQHFWYGLVLNLIYFFTAIVFFKVVFDISKKRGLLVKLE